MSKVFETGVRKAKMSRFISGLNGKEIRVASNNDLIYFNYNEHTPHSGIDFNLIEILKAYFNFTYKIVDCDHHWGSDLGNGTWSGIIGKLQQGEAHLGINSVSLDYRRSQVVDFSVTYISEPLTFVTMMPEKTLPPLVFFSPFSFDVWLFIALLIFIYCVFCKLSQQLNSELLNVVSKGLKWSNWSVLTLFYSSNLASVVSSPKARDLIDSVTQLTTAAKEGKVIPLVVRDSREWALLKEPRGIFADIGKQMVGCRWNHEAFEMMLENNPNKKPKALIVGESIIKTKTKILGSQNFHLPQDGTLHFDFYAVAIRKGLGWKKAFDIVIERTVEADLFKPWWCETILQASRVITNSYPKIMSRARGRTKQSSDDIYIGFHHLKELAVTGSVTVLTLSAWILLIEIYCSKHFSSFD